MNDKTAEQTPGAKLDQTAAWSRRTFIVNAIGVMVLVIAVVWAGIQYFRANAAMSAAADKFLEMRERLKPGK